MSRERNLTPSVLGRGSVDASDIIEIHQLLGLYGHLVDAKEWDRFAEVFEADAVLDYTGVRAPRVFSGLEEIRQYFRDANHPSAHHVTNIVVSEVAGEVRVKSKFLAPYTRATHDPLRWFGGDYDDVVVRTPAGWRFRRRVCTGRWQFTPGEQEELPEHRRTW
jgi:3-phenylpropionate/cinnamic acid dioxygenase small subunit